MPLPVRNINEEMEKRLTVGQRTADAVANSMGSWRFILIQSGLLVPRQVRRDGCHPAIWGYAMTAIESRGPAPTLTYLGGLRQA